MQTPTTETQWTADARVRPLLRSIRRSPVARKLYVHGLQSRYVDCALVADQPDYDRSDERVIALNRISNEYFLRAEAEGGRDAALAFVNDEPSVSDIIAGYDLGDMRGVS